METQELNTQERFLKNYIFNKELIFIFFRNSRIEFRFGHVSLIVYYELRKNNELSDFFNFVNEKKDKIIDILYEYPLFRGDCIYDLTGVEIPKFSRISLHMVTKKRGEYILHIWNEKTSDDEIYEDEAIIHDGQGTKYKKIKNLIDEIESQII